MEHHISLLAKLEKCLLHKDSKLNVVFCPIAKKTPNPSDLVCTPFTGGQGVCVPYIVDITWQIKEGANTYSSRHSQLLFGAIKEIFVKSFPAGGALIVARAGGTSGQQCDSSSSREVGIYQVGSPATLANPKITKVVRQEGLPDTDGNPPPLPWKDWPQAKRDTAVGLLTDTDWQSLANSMPAGGVLDGADKLNAEKIVIPGQETDDPNTPADERLLRKEDGFFTWPGIADFDKDGFSNETDSDDDNDGTSDTSDPAPRNPSVPVAVNTEDAGENFTPEVVQEIRDIVSRHPNTKCVECATEIEAYFKEQGIHGKRIILDTERVTRYDDYIFDESLPPSAPDGIISENGHHEGIAIKINGEEIVFDNHHPDGIPYEQWKNNLTFEGKRVFGADFKDSGYLFFGAPK